MLISRREFYLDLDHEGLDNFFKEINSSLMKENIPEGYNVKIYKDQVACCGVFPIGVAIEIEGPKEQLIKDLDVKMYSKILEMCEGKGIEIHESSALDILQY